MEETTTRLLFRAGRETAAFDEAALRTAEQAKRRAKKRGQGRLQHQAAMLVTAVKASYKTTAVLEIVKTELASVFQELADGGGPDNAMEHIDELLGVLHSGEVEMSKPESKGFCDWLRGLFVRGK